MVEISPFIIIKNKESRMKTFAAAIIATSAVAIQRIAEPDFVSGFIYKVSGGYYTPELELCYQNEEESLASIINTFADIRNGDYVRGIEKAG